MPAWTGKTIGKVLVGEMIARGGMAEVYLGEHIALNRKVAVKIMRDQVDTDPDTKARFDREARVVAGLRHPNIIQMYDYELVDGQPCLIMEYVRGATLAAYLKELHKRGEKLPFKTVAHILQALASAIDYSHGLHIVHRDIKPANVLLRSAGEEIELDKPLPDDVEPILTDFGLVRLLDSSIQTSTGTVSGTPTYMSPEQARGDKVDAQTDIYSLGVMLYEMLAGNVPFDAESSFGILMKHINEPPPPIFGISSDLQAVIDRALAKDPAFRYHTAKELVDEFIAVFNGQTVSLNTAKFAGMANRKPDSTDTKPARPSNRALAWIGVLIFAVVAIVAVRFFLSAPVAADQNKTVGQVSYLDFNVVMDKATISITDLPAPKSGTHYEVWFLSQGGEIRRNIGVIKMDESGHGTLAFTDPNEKNILGAFDQVEVTIEPDNDPNPDESSGDVIASSVFPPLALIHVRHVDSMFQAAPNQIALIQGVWFTADDIASKTKDLQSAYQDGNEALFRKTAEELINEMVGNANPEQYKDWNGDGAIDDTSDGYGLIQNGDQGYISQAISHAGFAAQSLDATENIKTRSAQLVTCLKNMDGWSRQLLEKALALKSMSFGKDMEPLISDMADLSTKIVKGVDSNNNGLIEPITGEGGADTAYEYAYYMADMPLLLGPRRVPPPAPTQSK